MLRPALIISAIVMLSACGDPLAGLQRISDVDLAETDPAAQALPSAEEIAREGFFGTSAAESPQGLSDDAAQSVAVKPEPQSGIWGLLRRAIPTPTEAESEQALAAPVSEATDTATTADVDAAVQLASLSGDPMPAPVQETRVGTKKERGKKTGFLSGLLASREPAKDETALPEVDYDAVVPFGVIARSCAARGQALGRKVETAGTSGYRLYDSNPRATGPRTYYITGFDDGCPRKLTASNVLLGAPSFYEQLHYGPTGRDLDFGATDQAYEKVKSRVCGVRKGKPCGNSMKKLERSTFFVNSYPRANDNNSWSEMLVHDGKVMATEIKGNG